MKLDFDFDIDNKDLLDKQTLIKALKRTVKDEGIRFRTNIVKRTKEEYAVKATTLKPHIKSKLNANNFHIDITSHRLPLANFKVSKGKRGDVKVRVLKRRGSKVVIDGFMINGHIFKRETEERLPITKLSTLSIPQMFTKENIEESRNKVNQNFKKTFEKNYNYYANH
jgi:hypothetical protein